MIRFLVRSSFLFFLSFSPLYSAQRIHLSCFRKNPRFADKIHIHGVKDAEKINVHLYCGSQPDAKGLRALQQLGVTTIVDLRGEFRRGSANEKKKLNRSA